MLNRYSNSLSCSLTVGQSRQRRRAVAALALAVTWASGLVFLKGYPFLGAASTLGSLVLLWRALPDPMQGAVLSWEGGEWFLRHRGRQTSLVLLPGSVRLPWLVYAAFQETHAKQRWVFLLFTDCARPEELRRLRCRLTLAA